MNIDDTRDLMHTLMTELVPTEDFDIDIEEVDGQLKLELRTESKRAVVAWSELSFMLEQVIQKSFDENIGS